MTKISAEEFDRKFDAGEDVSEYLNWSSARWGGSDAKRVNVDFTVGTVNKLDHYAAETGITRQALIKTWISDRLKHEADREARLRGAARPKAAE